MKAKGDVNRPDRHLFNRHSDGTGGEERPLRGTNPEPARRRSLSSQLTNLRSKRPGGEKSLATSDVAGILNAPALNPLRRVLFLFSTRLKFWTVPE